MESQPQNPEYKGDPENFHPCSYQVKDTMQNISVSQNKLGQVQKIIVHITNA